MVIIENSPPGRNPTMRYLPQIITFFAVTGLLTATWIVAFLKPYTPGSDLGYNLGLVGGVMMLTLIITYPLRKYVKAFRRLGPMKPWFQAHIMLGIVGPMLILFHTTFVISSVNAFVAFMSMVIVVSSGFIGRYAYRRIHHGLYGRKATLEEFEEHMRSSERGLASLVKAIPEAETALAEYRKTAFSREGSFATRAWRFLTMGRRARRVAGELEQHIARLIREGGPSRGWDEQVQARRIRRGAGLVRSYLRAVNAAAQFGTFERIFALWHIMHVPLLYLLALSGVYHVIAVHMY
jgi:hypothetical protein